MNPYFISSEAGVNAVVIVRQTMTIISNPFKTFAVLSCFKNSCDSSCIFLFNSLIKIISSFSDSSCLSEVARIYIKKKFNYKDLISRKFNFLSLRLPPASDG